jgi:hypothetical protein
LYRLARIGAVARLQELEIEAAAIRHAFPGLKKAQGVAPTFAPAAKPKAKKRKKMSAEARKAIGARMKAYWATKRQAETQAPPESGTTAEASKAAPKPKKTAKKTVAKKQRAAKK